MWLNSKATAGERLIRRHLLHEVDIEMSRKDKYGPDWTGKGTTIMVLSDGQAKEEIITWTVERQSEQVASMRWGSDVHTRGCVHEAVRLMWWTSQMGDHRLIDS